MHSKEFANLSRTEYEELIKSMTQDEINDFVDALLFTPKEFTERDDRRYFDDIDEYLDYLINNTHLKHSPDAIRSHELAHAKGAMLVGATSVKFYTRIIKIGSASIEYGAFTDCFFDSDIPNIAFAAIFAAPKIPSSVDMDSIRKSAYTDLGYLRERIQKWNDNDSGLLLPLPGELEIE